jgi:fructosamine-3-kinase
MFFSAQQTLSPGTSQRVGGVSFSNSEEKKWTVFFSRDDLRYLQQGFENRLIKLNKLTVGRKDAIYIFKWTLSWKFHPSNKN